MCRFTCGVLLVLAVFFAIWGLFGWDVFFWVVFTSFFGLSIASLFMPRRGVQNAYRNRAVLSLGAGLLLGIGVGIGGIVAGTALMERGILPNVSPEPYMAILMAPIVGSILAPVLWVVYTPTRSRLWLRRKYPRVAAAIERYRKSGEVRETYIPAVVLDGRRWFCVFYMDKSNRNQVRGGILLDEEGRVLDDPALARRAMKLRHLAQETIDYYRHQARARQMLGGERAIRGTKYVFQTLGKKKERFVALGPQVLADWEAVMAMERPVLSLMEAIYAMKTLEAEWAKGHGLGRLTEVREEEYLAFEAQLLELRRPYEVAAPQFVDIVEPARRLAETVRGMWEMPHAKEVAEGLLGIADSGESLQRGGWDDYEYFSLHENEWQAWRERTAWAKEVEAVRGDLGLATP